MTMVVDSGASDHYMDDELVNGIEQRMFDYQEFDTQRTITTTHDLELPQENYGARSPTATAGQEWRLYPSQLCLVYDAIYSLQVLLKARVLQQ